MRLTRRFTLLATAFALLAFASPAAAEVVPTVTVRGVHEETVRNDAARVGFGVSVEAKTSVLALDATAKRLRAVIAKAREAGDIAKADVETGRISVRKVTLRDAGGHQVGVHFRASESVQVTVLEVKRTGDVVAAAVAAGATAVNGPHYFVTDSEGRYQHALLAAFDVAKAKAEALATHSGRTLGDVLSITEGGGVVSVQGDSAGGTAQAPSAVAPPVHAGSSRVRGKVTAVFELR